MNPQKRGEIFARLARANPKPTTELEYRTPYELLVSVILSAQATDRSVNLATAELFKVADTPQKMLALGLEHLPDRDVGALGVFSQLKRKVEVLKQEFWKATLTLGELNQRVSGNERLFEVPDRVHDVL